MPPIDSTKPGEMPTEQGGEMPEGQPQTLEQLQAEVTRMREALAKANSEAKKYRRLAKEAKQSPAQSSAPAAEAPEVDQLRQAKADAEAKAAKALEVANKRLILAEFKAAATSLGVKNPGDAYALALADGLDIEVDEDGKVEGVAEIVKGFVDAGRLPVAGRASAPSLDGGSGGGNRPAPTVTLTPEQKQLARIAGMTEEQYVEYMLRGAAGQQSASQDEKLNKFMRS
jgi:hypothetical protein